MSLADELLSLAARLLSSEMKNEATFRRSISTSYYAVFHLLVNAATEMLIEGSQREGLRAAVRRAFTHTRMADACKAFMRDRHKLSALISSSPSQELRWVCQSFLELQEERHRSDYDTSASISYDDAFDALIVAVSAFTFWQSVRDTEDARVFLVALLLWKDLRD